MDLSLESQMHTNFEASKLAETKFIENAELHWKLQIDVTFPNDSISMMKNPRFYTKMHEKIPFVQLVSLTIL